LVNLPNVWPDTAKACHAAELLRSALLEAYEVLKTNAPAAAGQAQRAAAAPHQLPVGAHSDSSPITIK
jgi:hypothetical protein